MSLPARSRRWPADRVVALLACALLASAPATAADFSKLFRAADPSVVVLYTLERELGTTDDMVGVSRPGLGSGVVIDDEGHILTAAHVVQTADLVEAEFTDGFRSPVAVLASDPGKDVALLKLDRVPASLKPARVGDSDRMRVGDEVFIIGAPYGLGHTLSVGHISARHADNQRSGGPIAVETFQTDAAINKGNSGGPMFNVRGEVVGIVSHIKSQSGGSEGLGFAVTSNAAMRASFDQRMAWTGLSGVMLSGALAAAVNLPQPHGFLIQKVAAGSPAARIGLRASSIPARIGSRELLLGGDILLGVAGVDMGPKFLDAFRARTAEVEPGSLIVLRLLRQGKVLELEVPLER